MHSIAGLGASGDPVSADQGPVQADERLAVPAEPVQDVAQELQAFPRTPDATPDWMRINS